MPSRDGLRSAEPSYVHAIIPVDYLLKSIEAQGFSGRANR